MPRLACTLALGSALALTLAAATPAAALDLPPLCQALHGLADAAKAGGGPQRISVVGGACTPGADAARGRAFCDAATAAMAGAADLFPWVVHDCVNTLAAETTKQFAAGDVGPKHKPRMTKLTANLGHGARLDIALAGDRYDLVVWSIR